MLRSLFRSGLVVCFIVLLSSFVFAGTLSVDFETSSGATSFVVGDTATIEVYLTPDSSSTQIGTTTIAFPVDNSVSELDVSSGASGSLFSSLDTTSGTSVSQGSFYASTTSFVSMTPSTRYYLGSFDIDFVGVGSQVIDLDTALSSAVESFSISSGLPTYGYYTLSSTPLSLTVTSASSGGGSSGGSSGAYDVSFLMLRDSDQDGIPDRKAIRKGDPFDVLIYVEALNDFDSVSFDVVPSDPSVATITQGVSGDLLDGVATSNVGGSSGTWTYSQRSSSAVLPSGRSHLATFTVSPGGAGLVDIELRSISVLSGSVSRTFASSTLTSLEVFATSGFTSLDNDGDGVTADVDCDDNDAGQRAADYYYDIDGDGYGDASQTNPLCRVLFLEIDAQNNLDCDDGNFDVNSGASEICDAIDNDCDGLVDDADSSVDSSTMSTFYLDSDGDGYGDSPKRACAAPLSYVTLMPDCNDVDASIYPGASEICADGVDNNCDGAIDDFDSSGVSCTSSTYELPDVSMFLDMLMSHFRSPLTTTEELDYDFDQTSDSAGFLDLGDIREYICLTRTGSACGGSS